jgi:hypothetical protein
LAVGVLQAGAAKAGVVEERVTTTYTSRGTVTEVLPGTSTFVITSQAAPEPVRYAYTNKTTFVDAAGNVVTRESIVNQPVEVFYSTNGGVTEVSKVVVTKPAAPRVIEKTIETETIR